MAKSKKIQAVKLSEIDVHMSRNVREQSEESYNDPAMRDSLALVGQQTIAKLLKLPNGRYEPIQGNRRVFNLKILADAGVLDPKTAKRDADGNILRDDAGKPVGARVFETLESEVYEGLSERERMELVFDHGNIRSLNKAELFYALEMLFSAGNSEKEVVIMSYGLLAHHYPPSRQVKDTSSDGGQDALEYYRGVVQTAKDAWRSPIVVRDSWVTKLKTGRAWPIKKEMTQAFAIYKKECDEDKTGKLNRHNPGPKFREFWTGIVNKHEAAAAKGEKRAKSSASMNHQQIADKVGVCDSRILKAALKIVLRQISEDKLPVLDAGLVKWANGDIDAKGMDAVLDSVFESDESDDVMEPVTVPNAGAAANVAADKLPDESQVDAEEAAAEETNVSETDTDATGTENGDDAAV